MVGLKSLRLPEKLRVHCWRVWKFREYCHYRDNGFLLPKAKLEVGHLHCSDHSAPFIKAVEPWGIRLLYKINETYFFALWFAPEGKTTLPEQSWSPTSSVCHETQLWAGRSLAAHSLGSRHETVFIWIRNDLIALPGSIRGVVLFISIIYQRFY